MIFKLWIAAPLGGNLCQGGEDLSVVPAWIHNVRDKCGLMQLLVKLESVFLSCNLSILY